MRWPNVVLAVAQSVATANDAETDILKHTCLPGAELLADAAPWAKSTGWVPRRNTREVRTALHHYENTGHERFPRIFHGSSVHVHAPFCAEERSPSGDAFLFRNIFRELMVGGTGIEPVTPPVW